MLGVQNLKFFLGPSAQNRVGGSSENRVGGSPFWSLWGGIVPPQSPPSLMYDSDASELKGEDMNEWYCVRCDQIRVVLVRSCQFPGFGCIRKPGGKCLQSRDPRIVHKIAENFYFLKNFKQGNKIKIKNTIAIILVSHYCNSNSLKEPFFEYFL